MNAKDLAIPMEKKRQYDKHELAGDYDMIDHPMIWRTKENHQSSNQLGGHEFRRCIITNDSDERRIVLEPRRHVVVH